MLNKLLEAALTVLQLGLFTPPFQICRPHESPVALTPSSVAPTSVVTPAADFANGVGPGLLKALSPSLGPHLIAKAPQKRAHNKLGRSRNASYEAPPPQIRAGTTNAHGSCLGSDT
jgi:hypothetical protein